MSMCVYVCVCVCVSMCASVSVWVTAAHSAHYLFAYQDNQHLLSVIVSDTHRLDLSSEVLMNISSLAAGWQKTKLTRNLLK